LAILLRNIIKKKIVGNDFFTLNTIPNNEKTYRKDNPKNKFCVGYFYFSKNNEGFIPNQGILK